MHMCPQCNKELDVPQHAIGNMDVYNNKLLVNTECCGFPVVLIPQRSYTVLPYTGVKKEDDWGNPIKRVAPQEYIQLLEQRLSHIAPKPIYSDDDPDKSG